MDHFLFTFLLFDSRRRRKRRRAKKIQYQCEHKKRIIRIKWVVFNIFYWRKMIRRRCNNANILWKMKSLYLLCRFMTPTCPPKLTMIYWHSFRLLDWKFYFIVVSKKAFGTIINNILRAIQIIRRKNARDRDREWKIEQQRIPLKNLLKNNLIEIILDLFVYLFIRMDGFDKSEKAKSNKVHCES